MRSCLPRIFAFGLLRIVFRGLSSKLFQIELHDVPMPNAFSRMLFDKIIKGQLVEGFKMAAKAPAKFVPLTISFGQPTIPRTFECLWATFF